MIMLWSNLEPQTPYGGPERTPINLCPKHRQSRGRGASVLAAVQASRELLGASVEGAVGGRDLSPDTTISEGNQGNLQTTEIHKTHLIGFEGGSLGLGDLDSRYPGKWIWDSVSRGSVKVN